MQSYSNLPQSWPILSQDRKQIYLLNLFHVFFPGNKDEIQEAVLMVEIVQKQTVFGFWGEELENFLKITVALPKLVAGAKRLLEKVRN